MKALSITEPYASLIRDGLKHIETRSWKTNYRGSLLIHASATRIPEDWKSLLSLIDEVHQGYIICRADLVDCVRMTDEYIDSLDDIERATGFYSPGRYAWVLENIRPVSPIPAKGRLGIWEYSGGAVMNITEYKSYLDESRLPAVREVAKHGMKGSRLSTPQDVASLAEAIFGDSVDEVVWVFCIDHKCKCIGAFEVSHGSSCEAFIEPRSIFQKALLLNAKSIFLCHNHPSGDITPSRCDLSSTASVKAAGEVIGIKLLDHIIIGNGYFSFAEEGVL